jgi:Domain of unknown function (DUF4126)
VDLGTAIASSWSSGISLYLVFSVLGIGGRLDWVDSPEFLQRPWVIAAAVGMFVVELVVDKISYIDSTWDAVHTFLRPLAGAYVFSSSDVSTSTIVLALIGGALALTAHGAKASTRLLVNASPEPASNFVVSLMEDGLVAALMTLALAYPVLAATIALILTIVSVVVIYVVWRSARYLLVRRRERRRNAPQ